MRLNLFLKSRGCIILCCAGLTASTACVKLPRRAAHVSTRHTQPADDRTNTLVSINRAPREELERLPGIGPALAARIVEHRQRHGPFRRPEHLLLIRGLSERRLRELLPLITTD